MALKRSSLPVRQTASFRARLTVIPDPGGRTADARGRAPRRGGLLRDVPGAVPLGGPWTREADSKLEQVIVLSETLNERLFGGRNSVGQSLRIETRDFRIVGVLAGWQPTVRMYDMTGSALSEAEAVYMPFGLVVPMEIRRRGQQRRLGHPSGTGVAGLPQLGDQLATVLGRTASPNDDAAYRSFIESYIPNRRKSAGTDGR